jgi:molybdopterin synthase catalytic subunit
MFHHGLKEICEKIKRKWEVLRVAIAHRIGTVLIGEPSVIIAISSSHRKPALEV